MKQVIYTILENTPLTASVYRMALRGDTAPITAPGQFVNLQLNGLYLRRPISVCDVEGDRLTLIYKVVGKGTEQLARMAPGTALDALSGLGNGYDLSCAGERPVLIGGGVGVPPLYLLARRLLDQGKPVVVCLGFNAADEVFYEEAFCALGCDVRVSTVEMVSEYRFFAYSKNHGNTQKLLNAIAAENEVTLIDVTAQPAADLSGYDRIGMASGIYYSSFARQIVDWAEGHLPEGKPVFYIYTHGAPAGNFLKAMRKIAAARHCTELGEYHCQGFDTFGPFRLVGGIAKGHPTEAEIRGAVAFYRKL